MAATGLEGVAELTKKLRSLGKAVTGPALRSAVRAGMRPAFRKAQQTIPVGVDAHHTYKGRLVAPGFAKRSLRVITTVSNDGQDASAVLGVRAEAFYAVLFVEFGTSKMQANPWLRPSYYGTKDQQIAELASQLRKRVESAAQGN